jgi:SMODS-associated NUDIX domain
MILYYIISFILLGIFIFFGNNWIPDKAVSDTLHELSVGAFGALLGMAINTIINLRSKIWVCFLAATRYRYQHIRISAAYLFKIEIDGRYLLIKGRNIDQFQPVGGVYKRLPDSSKLFQELGILDDKQIPISDTTRHDLRIRVKGSRIHKFLQWFDSNQDREISHWREFCEELIRTHTLNSDVFPHINYKFLHRNPLYIHHSVFYNCPEILIHEVYELLPTDAQVTALKQLMQAEQPASKFRWVTEDAIRRLGYLPDNTKPFAIAEHSISLFDKEFKIK